MLLGPVCGLLSLLSCYKVPVVPAGGPLKTPWNMGGNSMENRASSPEIFGFCCIAWHLVDVVFIMLVNSAAGGIDAPTDRAAALTSLVGCVFGLPCWEFIPLPSFLPWLQMLPCNPQAKNKQRKNPETLKLWLLNSSDQKKKSKKQAKKETNKTQKYLFCHKAWNFIVLQVWQNYRWEIELKREKRSYSKVYVLFKRESLWPTHPNFLISMKELLN